MLASITRVPKPLLFIGYVLSVSVLLYFLYQNWAYDDPFITYRYAQNLRQGVGFVYNPGVHVLSTTTPFFALLLALLSFVWNDLPHLAVFIGSLSLAMGGIFLWHLAEVWKTPRVGWAGLLLYPTFSILLSTLGSETPLYLTLCLGAWASYERKNYSLAAACSALAVLTRPDALVVVGILVLDYLMNVRSKSPWIAIAVFLAITMPWFIFSLLYFGSLVPATLFAKQQQASMAGASTSFIAGFIRLLQNLSVSYQYWIEGFLGLVGLLIGVTRFRRVFVFLLWAPLYFGGYAILGVTRYFWYYAPLVPAFVASVGLGLMALGSKFFNARISLGIAMSLLLLLSVFQVDSLLSLSQNLDARLSIYRDIGEWLRSNTSPDADVGTLEVGIIGYYSQRRVIDFAGLIQPDIASQLKPNSTYEDAAIWAVNSYHPDYLVLYDNQMPRLEQNYVGQHCILAQHFPGETYHFKSDLSIYTCSSAKAVSN